MYYLLYNPLSMKGKSISVAKKLSLKLSKKKIENDILSLIDIQPRIEEMIKNVSSDDTVVLIGGDGTLHQTINKLKNVTIPCRVMMYKAGSGNDFARGHKGKLFDITKEVTDLPTLFMNNQEIKFINGIGMGIDAMVCDEVNNNNKKESYFKTAVRCFKTFKPYDLDITIDSKEYHFTKVWFFVVNNGKYFGGGMKIAPKAVRNDDHLDIVIAHTMSRKKLVRVFPTIFIGKHVWFKKAITVLTGSDIKIKANGCRLLQADGEVSYTDNEITVKR